MTNADAQEWVAHAGADLHYARLGQKDAAALENLVAFHAQQAVEKALKAVLVSRGSRSLVTSTATRIEAADVELMGAVLRLLCLFAAIPCAIFTLSKCSRQCGRTPLESWPVLAIASPALISSGAWHWVPEFLIIRASPACS